MSHHICTKCKSDLFTIVDREEMGMTIKSFQCMTCGATDQMKAKEIIQRNGTKVVKLNTGIRRTPESVFASASKDHKVYIKRWSQEWKKLITN